MIATIHDPPSAPFTTGLTPWAQTLPQHISPSAAKSYLSCSLRFWFERVACIRKATPAALHLGKAVHAALQSFHLARWRGGDDSPEAIAAAYDLAFQRLERDEGPVNFDDDTEREKVRLDGLRVIAAYLDSPEAMKEKPRAVEVMLKEDIPGLSVPLTGAMDLVEGNFTPVDFKSAAARPDSANAVFDHEIQLVSYQLLLEAIGETPPSLDLVFLVKTKTPQVIRIPSPPANAHRKRRVTALLETAVEGIASNRHHPQPGMHCSWCQFKNECMAWLPGMTVEDIHGKNAA
jgi:putative RecB family exonuclease